MADHENDREKNKERKEDKKDDMESKLDLILNKFSKVEDRLDKLENKEQTEIVSTSSSAENGESSEDEGHSAQSKARTPRRDVSVEDATAARGSKKRKGRNEYKDCEKSARGSKRGDRTDSEEEEEFSVRDGNSDSFARGENDDIESVSDFRIQIEDKKNAKALDDLENDLEYHTTDGDKVHEKLAKAIHNRFTVKLPKDKLENKIKQHKIPKNCSVVKAPILDEELTEKGLVDKNTRKDDNRLADIQSLIATTTAALGNLSIKVNEASKSSDNKEVLEMADKVIETNGDAFAILGLAQQELSQRRRFEISRALPKDVASIATANIQTGSETLFGNNVQGLIRNARESYRFAANRGGARNGRGKTDRYRPYNSSKRYQGQGQMKSQHRPFLGKSQAPFGRGRGGNARNYRK